MIDYDITKEEAAILKTRGVDPQLLYGEKDIFDLEDVIGSYKSKYRLTKNIAIGVEAQLQHVASLISDPYNPKHREITCISSFPSDLRAKTVALQIFRSAVDDCLERSRKPLWLTIYGDRLDYESLRTKNPSLLVITGCNLESTQYKLERLRDVLEMFNTIPRIVVTGGDCTPLDMFTSRLYLPVKMGVLITADRVVKNLMDILGEM